MAQYDGYGSCPLTVERGTIVLAEFGYGGTLKPSFPKALLDGTRPTRAVWFLKERLLPPIYWKAMLRGREWMAAPEPLAPVGAPPSDPPSGPPPPGEPVLAGGAPAPPVFWPDGQDDMTALARYLPILDWGRRYDRAAFGRDAVAAVIVTIMLIPQSLAYALLAGLPPEAGIYASIAPILLYAVFGTSRALAVGPVAVVSLLTASAVGAGRRAGHGGLRGGGADARGDVGGVPRPAGRPALGISRELPEPSRDRGVHRRLWHPDRRQPDEAISSGSRPVGTR